MLSRVLRVRGKCCFVAIICLLIAALVLGGCDSGEPKETPTPTPTPTATPTLTLTPMPTPTPTPTPTSILQRDPRGHPEIMPSYITPNDPQVQSVVNDIRNRGLRVFTDFGALRDWVSLHITYRSDQEVHGVRDYWQLPTETLQLGTGDCEDFAILLCSLLRAYGVPADQVYVAAGYSYDEASGHAYLVEKWYKGIWRVIEPLAPEIVGEWISDWATSVSFKTAFCFNDQGYSEGLPTLPSGVYEFELSVLGGASAIFERYLNTGQQVTGLVEWLGKQGQEPEQFSIFGWGLRIYDPFDRVAFSWFGGDLQHSFNYTVQTPGMYKVEVYLGYFPIEPRPGRLTLTPSDWSKK